MTIQTAPAAPLLIGNLQIRRDCAGRYCLNDLHQAAGGHARHQPGRWLRGQQAGELLVALQEGYPDMGNGVPISGERVPKSEQGVLRSEQASELSPVETIQGGLTQGTYAVKPLVYAYAMWISPKFHLAVIAAYDALVTRQAQPAGHATASAALHTARARVVNRLYRAQAPGEIEALHAQAAKLSLGLGLPVPEVPSAPASPVEAVLADFWTVVDAGIAAGQLHSHARNPAWLALNLPEVRRAAEQQKAALPASTGLTWALVACASQPRGEQPASVGGGQMLGIQGMTAHQLSGNRLQEAIAQAECDTHALTPPLDGSKVRRKELKNSENVAATAPVSIAVFLRLHCRGTDVFCVGRAAAIQHPKGENCLPVYVPVLNLPTSSARRLRTSPRGPISNVGDVPDVTRHPSCARTRRAPDRTLFRPDRRQHRVESRLLAGAVRAPGCHGQAAGSPDAGRYPARHRPGAYRLGRRLRGVSADQSEGAVMSAHIRNAARTPAEVLNSIHYRVHELDVDRLWQAQQAADLLSLLDTNQPSPITLDHVAAVAAYIAGDLREVLGNTHRAVDVPADDLADTL